MNTAPGRGEEDACSSVSARGRGADAHAYITGQQSKNTLARWLRQVLNGAGVDTAQFSAHSTRVASPSTALSSGVPVDVVLRAAGWSSESTFTRFYRQEPAVNMGQALLDSYLHKN